MIETFYSLKTELPGNLSKLKIIIELSKYIEQNNRLKIIDVGCGGMLPFNLWEYLLNNYKDKFLLYGVDISDIEEAEDICKRNGWQNVNLRKLSGYRLSENFDTNHFDVVISTQVLEHIKHLEYFLLEIKSVTKEDGLIYFTLDSAYYRREKSLKSFIKNTLALIGIEKFYLSPLYDYCLEALFKKLNLIILDKRFYNIHPLKEIHNHKIPKDKKNDLLLKWFAYEELLNEDKIFIKENKSYFTDLYYKLLKR